MITNTKEAFEMLKANVDVNLSTYADEYVVKAITYECIDYIERELDWYKNAFKELMEDQNRLFEVLYPGEYLLDTGNGVQANHELTDWLIKTYGDKHEKN